MRKPRLMTPGPAMVPEDVLLELARPVIHHRSAEAKQVIVEVLAGLKEVFQTQNDILILTASGTGAMEAAAVNTVPPGGKALVLNAGHFAARWGSICRAYGLNAVMLETDWGQPVDPDQVAEALRQHSDTVCVMGTLSETSTGTGHPVEAIGRIVAQTPAVFAVDGTGNLTGLRPGSPFIAGNGTYAASVNPAATRLYLTSQEARGVFVFALDTNGDVLALRPGSPFLTGVFATATRFQP